MLEIFAPVFLSIGAAIILAISVGYIANNKCKKCPQPANTGTSVDVYQKIMNALDEMQKDLDKIEKTYSVNGSLSLPEREYPLKKFSSKEVAEDFEEIMKAIDHTHSKANREKTKLLKKRGAHRL